MKFENIKSKIYDRLLDTGLSTDECVAAADDIAKMVGAADFDAILAEAKNEHTRMADAVSAARTLPDIRDARDKWSAWTKTNLTDRGIRMTIKADTGEPLGLFVVVAGSDN